MIYTKSSIAGYYKEFGISSLSVMFKYSFPYTYHVSRGMVYMKY